MINQFNYSKTVVKNFIVGFSLFLLIEVLIFSALFWSWIYIVINFLIWMESIWFYFVIRFTLIAILYFSRNGYSTFADQINTFIVNYFLPNITSTTKIQLYNLKQSNTNNTNDQKNIDQDNNVNNNIDESERNIEDDYYNDETDIDKDDDSYEKDYADDTDDYNHDNHSTTEPEYITYDDDDDYEGNLQTDYDTYNYFYCDFYLYTFIWALFVFPPFLLFLLKSYITLYMIKTGLIAYVWFLLLITNILVTGALCRIITIGFTQLKFTKY